MGFSQSFQLNCKLNLMQEYISQAKMPGHTNAIFEEEIGSMLRRKAAGKDGGR